mmetsp:Transcript_17509/g.32946  ORF Transcript_17509/g.32946 Transcript_17509/m.32946 type:complete len:206 (+) Transcript_17509:242-859(+)
MTLAHLPFVRAECRWTVLSWIFRCRPANHSLAQALLWSVDLRITLEAIDAAGDVAIYLLGSILCQNHLRQVQLVTILVVGVLPPEEDSPGAGANLAFRGTVLSRAVVGGTTRWSCLISKALPVESPDKEGRVEDGAASILPLESLRVEQMVGQAVHRLLRLDRLEKWQGISELTLGEKHSANAFRSEGLAFLLREAMLFHVLVLL